MAKPGTWKTLIDDNLVGRVTLFFERVIGDSMTSHPMRHFTQAEVKRRFDICCSIFEKLRGDLKWGVDRIEHHLPTYFRAELDGSTWTPDARKFWLPEDGAAPMVRDGAPIEADDDADKRIVLPGDPGFN